MKPTELVRPLLRKGLSPAEIRKELTGMVAVKDINKIIAKDAKRKGKPVRPRRRAAISDGYMTLNVSISHQVRDTLRPHAERRAMSLAMLCGRILDASIDCVDAVLDDGEILQ